MNPLYTAEALATGGGRNGHVTTSDARLDLALAIPTEMGGSGQGANPEQLFAAGYAAPTGPAFLGALAIAPLYGLLPLAVVGFKIRRRSG